MREPAVKAVESWSVAGADRLVGKVRVTNEDGLSSGRTIITSRVTHMVFKGDPPTPVAVTTSGSEYWLGTPAERQRGEERPEEFVARKSGSGAEAEDGVGASSDGATAYLSIK